MDENKGEILPPLPASDPGSLEQNKYDPVYQTTPRSFWRDNQVIREELKPFEKCEHYFEGTEEGAKCKKCHFGITGFFEVREGNLFYKGEPIITNELTI